MYKRTDILSALVLIVYGTLALVAVPLHHHQADYTDSPQFHSSSPFHNVECSVCTFASNNGIDEITTFKVSVVETQSGTFYPRSEDVNQTLSTIEYPRRGPPSFPL